MNNLPIVAVVYLTTQIGVRFLFYKKKYAWFVLFCLLTTFLEAWLGVLLWRVLDPQVYCGGILFPSPRVMENLPLGVFFTLFATALKVMKDLVMVTQYRAELAAQNLQGELTALRQQVSPHFLLNSLNTVYGLALTEPQKVAPTVLQLSDLLRFSLYETNTDRVSLAQELDFLRDYMALQQLRASEKLAITLEFPEKQNVPPLEIAPLILLVFIENGFKHAQANAQGERFLRMSVQLMENKKSIQLEVNNTFSTQKQTAIMGGMGLENVNRRLELIYPGRYQLQSTDEAGIWTVQLQLELEPTPNTPI